LWFSGWGAGGLVGGLVVAGGVEGEVAEEFAGGGVDDADVEVGDEEDDGGSGVGSSEADVVEAAVVAEGDPAGGVDAVVADPVVGVGVAAGGGGLGAGLVDGGGGGVCGEGAVGALVVVEGDEVVDEGLQLGDRVGWWLAGQPVFEGLLEAFDAPMFVKPLASGCWPEALLGQRPGGCCRSRGRCSA
jgi:hypothetical protein